MLMESVKKARSNQSGFTLIELLIVIVILGILSAVVVFAVGGITDKGNLSACKADVKTVEVASEAYRAQNGSYAADIPALKAANFLRDLPSTNHGYTVTYSSADGSVSATGLTGCP